MFISMPESKFDVPSRLAVPGASYWRSLALTTSAAWYVLTVRPRDPKLPVLTFLLAWDDDIPDAISSVNADITDLLYVASEQAAGGHGWYSRRIGEIWEGANPIEGNDPCVILVGEDGVEYSGPFMTADRGAIRTRLIARIKNCHPDEADQPSNNGCEV